MKRSEARESAFILIYDFSLRNESFEGVLETANESEELKIDDFSVSLANKCYENIEKIDEIIVNHLDNWKINRLPILNLAAIRLAITEFLFFDEIPVAVTVNEVVELLKKYAVESDASFANGVLGSVVKDLNLNK